MVTKRSVSYYPTDIRIITQVFRISEVDVVPGVIKLRLEQLLVLPAQEELI
jgi:hypothetical protein